MAGADEVRRGGEGDAVWWARETARAIASPSAPEAVAAVLDDLAPEIRAALEIE